MNFQPIKSELQNSRFTVFTHGKQIEIKNSLSSPLALSAVVFGEKKDNLESLKHAFSSLQVKVFKEICGQKT